MLFFLIVLGIFAFLTLIIFLLMISTIKINIQNFRVGNVKIKKKYSAKIQLFIFNKIKILSIDLNKNNRLKDIASKQIEKIDIKQIESNVKINKETLKIIKRLNIKIEKLKLYIQLGIEDAIITSYLTAIVATIIGIILPHFSDKLNNCKYIVQPLYNTKNQFNMDLDSIISVKMVHIIYVIYILIKRGRDKNERASNRRSYDYSYGQY